MLDPDPRSRWSMADVAHVLHRLRVRHAAADTRSVTAVASAPTPAPPAAPAAPWWAGSSSTAGQPTDDSDGPHDDQGYADGAASEALESGGATGAVTPGRPSDFRGRRRDRGGRLLVIGIVAVLALAALGGFLLLRDLTPAPDPGATGAARGRTSAASGSPHGSAGPSSSPATGSPTSAATSRAAPTSTGPSAPASGVPAQGSSATDFVTGYYALLPDDTADGWASLSPQFQRRIGYDHYRGFWATIRSVSVTSTRSVGARAVDVSLTYTRDDGGTEPEVRRIFLRRSGDGYLISNDRVVG